LRAKFIYESIESILKPKSKEEIISLFKKQSVVNQVWYLQDHGKNSIPKEHWPLIIKVKEELKNDEIFDGRFRVTYTDEIWTGEVGNYIGVVFKIYNRDDNINVIRIYQYNEYPNKLKMSKDFHNFKDEWITNTQELIKNLKEIKF